VDLALETHRASIADVDVLLANVQAGFDSFAEFAPLGWEPRPVERDREWTIEVLSDRQTWALLGLAGGRPVGHVAFVPAREPGHDDERHWSERARIPGLAHLWQLFVLPDWWGRGVAPALHAASVAEMRARGFEQARLYTPASHVRARRFYERRGWSARDEMWNEGLQLMLAEYWLTLAGTRSRQAATAEPD
jgi:GNAT superfamily N-acetyltransferase